MNEPTPPERTQPLSPEAVAVERVEELQARILAELLEPQEALELVEELWRLRGVLEEVRRDLGEVMESSPNSAQRAQIAGIVRRIRATLRGGAELPAPEPARTAER